MFIKAVTTIRFQCYHYPRWRIKCYIQKIRNSNI